MTADQWATPMPVDDVMLAFPANVLELMPSREECKAGLALLADSDRRKWIEFQQSWFYGGLPEDIEFYMRDGIDGETAFRHLSAIQGSFAPKHEHKEEAVAYLASRWIAKVDLSPRKSGEHEG